MEGSKTLFCSSKFCRAHENVSSKSMDSLGVPPQKGSPSLFYGNNLYQ